MMPHEWFASERTLINSLKQLVARPFSIRNHQDNIEKLKTETMVKVMENAPPKSESLEWEVLTSHSGLSDDPDKDLHASEKIKENKGLYKKLY